MILFIHITIVDESVSERESDSDEDPVTRVVNVFKRGDCFGETEILHNIPRQSTFTASTPCELLAIESEVTPSYVFGYYKDMKVKKSQKESLHD